LALNDANNRRGKLGELAVASELISSGCAVNSLTFMDLGLDLHVQLPEGLRAPSPDAQTWRMSGRAAHVQVKSTKTRSLPSISVETADTWRRGAQSGLPTLVVAAIPQDDETTQLRLFDPILVDRYAAKAKAARRDEYRIPVSMGLPLSKGDLLGTVAAWVRGSQYVFSDAVGLTWGDDGEGTWEEAIYLFARLTVIVEAHFRRDPMIEDGAQYGNIAETLALRFLDGAGVDDAFLDDVHADAVDSHGTRTGATTNRDVILVTAAEAVHDASTQDEGWSEALAPLSAITDATTEFDAIAKLGDLCRLYGQGSKKAPSLRRG